MVLRCDVAQCSHRAFELAYPGDFDENWVNLAYRFNGGTPFAGGLAMNFRFYDPLGSGATANTSFRLRPSWRSRWS